MTPIAPASARPVAATPEIPSTAPAQGRLVLISLILVAAVANLNLAVATCWLSTTRPTWQPWPRRLAPQLRRH